jgi:hypothetical protein
MRARWFPTVKLVASAADDRFVHSNDSEFIAAQRRRQAKAEAAFAEAQARREAEAAAKLREREWWQSQGSAPPPSQREAA